MGRAHALALNLTLAGVLVGVLFLLWRVDLLDRHFTERAAPAALTLDYAHMQHTTSWTSARGTETVTTVCREGESPEDCEERHDATVKRRQAEWPPVP